MHATSLQAGRLSRGVAAPASRAPAPRRSVAPPRAATTEAPAAEGTPVEFTSSKDLYSKFDELLNSSASNVKAGDRVTGTVTGIDRRGVYIDLGNTKTPAFCAASELSLAKVDKAEEVVSPGDARDFVVLREDTRTGEFHLSVRRAEEALLWRRFRQLYEEAASVDGLVTSFNGSGLMVEVQGQKGFVPGSHVPNSSDPADLVNTVLSLKLLEVDEDRQRLVLSNRRRQGGGRGSGGSGGSSGGGNTSAFKVGDVVLGTVAAVQVYGAFIDLGSGVNGLLHVSQISHDHVAAIDKVLNQGDKVKVLVLTHDRERGRISLSTKKLEPTPGDMLRDPALVFDRADEMAAEFRKLMKSAEAAAGGAASGGGGGGEAEAEVAAAAAAAPVAE